MPKNIVVCSDGTGNSGGNRGTNVWRIFNAVNRHRTDVKQITFYDDGVGTDSLRWLRALGGAFGWGLSKNLRQLYTFVVMNHQPGDRLYLFGFSRGAFTIRSLGAMISRCGLLEREKFLDLDPGKRERALNRILKAYRSSKKIRERKDGESYEVYDKHVREQLEIDTLPFRNECIPIHFIGVWDTVDAVGLPFDELKVMDWLSRRFFGLRLWGFHDRKLSRKVKHAYQALALDDERKTFHPNVWDPPDPAAKPPTCNGQPLVDQTIEQVWFAGVHSNVGGGYPKDSLSLVPLDWMMGKAHKHDLRFLPGTWKEYREQADTYGRLYDSRTGSGAFYRYAPRSPSERPVHVHASVFDRVRRGTDNYAPKVIGKASPDAAAGGVDVRVVEVATDAWPYSEQKGNDDGS